MKYTASLLSLDDQSKQSRAINCLYTDNDYDDYKGLQFPSAAPLRESALGRLGRLLICYCVYKYASHTRLCNCNIPSSVCLTKEATDLCYR